MNKIIEKSIETLRNMSVTKNYENYEEDLFKQANKALLKKIIPMTILPLSILVLLISSLFFKELLVNQPIYFTILTILTVLGMTFSTFVGVKIKQLTEKTEEEFNKRLAENDYFLEELKNKQLTSNEIKNLDSVMTFIKDKISNNDYPNILVKTKEYSKKEIGNAYFYYVLIIHHERFLNEIIEEQREKQL